MIGWIIYAVGVILCAVGAFVNPNAGLTPSLVILGIGCIVGALVYGLTRIE